MNATSRDPAWKPAGFTAADVEAVQACHRGEADPSQQKRAIDWIVTRAADSFEVSYRSDAHGGDRETSFAEGRRYVGLQIITLTKMTGAKIAQLRSKDG